MKKKKKYRGRLVGFWAYPKEEDKLNKIREKLQTRNDAATLRELIRKERV